MYFLTVLAIFHFSFCDFVTHDHQPFGNDTTPREVYSYFVVSDSLIADYARFPHINIFMTNNTSPSTLNELDRCLPAIRTYSQLTPDINDTKIRQLALSIAISNTYQRTLHRLHYSKMRNMKDRYDLLAVSNALHAMLDTPFRDMAVNIFAPSPPKTESVDYSIYYYNTVSKLASYFIDHFTTLLETMQQTNLILNVISHDIRNVTYIVHDSIAALRSLFTPRRQHRRSLSDVTTYFQELGRHIHDIFTNATHKISSSIDSIHPLNYLETLENRLIAIFYKIRDTLTEDFRYVFTLLKNFVANIAGFAQNFFHMLYYFDLLVIRMIADVALCFLCLFPIVLVMRTDTMYALIYTMIYSVFLHLLRVYFNILPLDI